MNHFTVHRPLEGPGTSDPIMTRPMTTTRRLSSRPFAIALLGLCALVASPGFAQTFTGKIGINLGDLDFVDMMKGSGEWQTLAGGKAALDANGWPIADARIVVFDKRPFGAWAPPEDDPLGYQEDMSGTYKVSFAGTARLSSYGSPFSVTDQRYDTSTDRTTLDLTLGSGQNLLIITFQETHGGVRDVKILRPGYADDGTVYRRELLAALCPFSAIRFMGWVSANSSTPPYTDSDHLTHWANRKHTTDATQGPWGQKLDGVAWEHCIALCDQTKKDIWINVPIAADDDYVRQLATLLRSSLDPSLRIYVEYSNEVWNGGFPQFDWNRSAALDEIAHGASNLNDDGETFGLYLAARRFARRTKEIGEIFGEVFGPSAFGTRYRPVLASQIAWTEPILQGLRFLARQFGPPSKYLYAIAGAPYFGNSGLNRTATAAQVLDSMRVSSDSSRSLRQGYHAIAASYGLPLLAYEGGPDVGGGDTTNIANRIGASRDTTMGTLITHDLRENWFPLGGDLFMYFTLNGNVSRYGCWGALEDLTKPTSPKYLALKSLSGACDAGVHSTESECKDMELVLVPNPSTDHVRIEATVPSAAVTGGDDARIAIIDECGRVAMAPITTRASGGHFELMLDLSGLASGHYLVRVQAGDAVSTAPLQITR